MAGLVHWRPITCACSFNLQDDGTFVTREEAMLVHRQLYEAEPWRVRLFNPATGEKTTHTGIPEGDPQIGQLQRAGWVFLHTVEPGFPEHFKNIVDPDANPQPFPSLGPEHAALGHTRTRFDAVRHEVTRLEKANQILTQRLGLSTDVMDDLHWSFTGDTVVSREGSRVLVLAPTRGTILDKTFLRSALDLEFGAGEVIVG